MIRALALLFACLTLAGCSQKQQPALVGRPALWAIEDGRGQPQGWLFGTIHALPPHAQWQSPILVRVIGMAGVLVVEVRDLDPAAIAAQFERLARDSPGPPLARRLPPAEQRDLAAWLASEGATSRPYDGLETWAAALALARLGEDSSPQNGVDRVLLDRFRHRPIAELEGAADQLAIFDRLPEASQRAMLAAVIAEHDESDAEAMVLARAWIAGDLAEIDRASRTGFLADPALYDALLAERNAAWVGKVASLLSTGQRPLVAVGAAHLVGPDGIPALLDAKGYRVRRIQ